MSFLPALTASYLTTHKLRQAAVSTHAALLQGKNANSRNPSGKRVKGMASPACCTTRSCLLFQQARTPRDGRDTRTFTADTEPDEALWFWKQTRESPGWNQSRHPCPGDACSCWRERLREDDPGQSASRYRRSH